MGHRIATDTFCAAGCQSKFGTCDAETDISTDGFCGKNGKVCKGSKYGDCCSAEGYRGKEDGHCGAGCQPKFGTCAAETNISTDGFCGKNGKGSKGSKYGDCCSAQGYCGKESGHCDAGCQSAFGSCNNAAGNIFTDGQCGKNGKTCKGSTFGDCCSPQGWCGKEKDHCGTGCQSSFGTCDASSSNVSTDGNCGKNGKICKGSKWGDCCSKNGFCGKGDDYCRDGCQTAYGLCTGISTDAECGSRNGKTCVGSGLGNYCSANGFCGSTSTHCGQGCQKGSSSACLTKNIPTLDESCGRKVGLTCAGGPFNGQCCSAAGFCGTSTHCGSGCYGHPDLAGLSDYDVEQQMTLLSNEFSNMIGKYPVYMRPPYFSFNARTLGVLGQLGYKIIIADIDTNDWKHQSFGGVEPSLASYYAGLNNGGSIVLMHDVHQNTVQNILPRIIQATLQSGKRAVTVGECLGDPETNWYRGGEPQTADWNNTETQIIPVVQTPAPERAVVWE
ncbi:hypothetical protein IL306_004688 [Fusarium sp. DS 682]|nr:hypothetical protein IL306_004688 [Fusarium sp. DS 682]